MNLPFSLYSNEGIVRETNYHDDFGSWPNKTLLQSKRLSLDWFLNFPKVSLFFLLSTIETDPGSGQWTTPGSIPWSCPCTRHGHRRERIRRAAGPCRPWSEKPRPSGPSSPIRRHGSRSDSPRKNPLWCRCAWPVPSACRARRRPWAVVAVAGTGWASRGSTAGATPRDAASPWPRSPLEWPATVGTHRPRVPPASDSTREAASRQAMDVPSRRWTRCSPEPFSPSYKHCAWQSVGDSSTTFTNTARLK